MKTLTTLTAVVLSLISADGMAQTTDTEKQMEKMLRMQDSVMNTKAYKDMIQMLEDMKKEHQKTQRKYEEADKTYRAQQKEEAAKAPAQPRGNLFRENPLLDINVAYSAVSYMYAKNPGNGGVYKNTLKIHQQNGNIRFDYFDKKWYQPTTIFRTGRNIILLIHPEDPKFEGVKLYQEFPLDNGLGVNAHIDKISLVFRDLNAPEKLTKVGTETVNGFSCVHYRKKEVFPWGPPADNTYITDYWIDKHGILIKMSYKGPQSNGWLETRNIKLGPQPERLFTYPPGYKKAGDSFIWREEKEKLDASKKQH